MSNVLIGIIGVILFIGLALAGALFLGPRFQESTNNSKASAVVQAVSQVSAAVNMRDASTGTRMNPSGPPGDVGTLVSEGYLKTVPANAARSGTAPVLMMAAGSGQDIAPASHVVMGLGSNEAICRAIARQTSTPQPDAETFVAAASMPGTSGCIRASNSNGAMGFVQGEFVAYSRI